MNEFIEIEGVTTKPHAVLPYRVTFIRDGICVYTANVTGSPRFEFDLLGPTDEVVAEWREVDCGNWLLGPATYRLSDRSGLCTPWRIKESGLSQIQVAYDDRVTACDLFRQDHELPDLGFQLVKHRDRLSVRFPSSSFNPERGPMSLALCYYLWLRFTRASEV